MVKWLIKEQNEDLVKDISEKMNIDPVISRLLCNRGLDNVEKIKSFFDTDIKNLHNPMLLNDMDKAVFRIKKALENNEKMTIYGDYDVDGITSVVVLYKYLKSKNAIVDYYIPDRSEEGYGLNDVALNTIKESGTTLVITVDTGTTAVEEINSAAEIGLDIIVTDHHECKKELPHCIAVVNPKRDDSTYPYKELAGVGVVFKLVCALMDNTRDAFNKYGELVAIGTIADIMPLIDENRILVLYGLSVIQTKPSMGVKTLLDATGGNKTSTVNAGVVAYQIAPRLNAAGRIGNPSVSVNLLLSTDIEAAKAISNDLCAENRERQLMEYEILSDVEKMLPEKDPNDKIFIFSSAKWHHGVIGIVASRIVERYNKPCILICLDKYHSKGSARSIKGVSIFELLCNVSTTLEKFGGHEMAAGLTLSSEKYNEFVSEITKYANEKITEEMLIPVVETECELLPNQLTLELAKKIHLLEPFGTGNPTPLFFVKNMKISEILSVGAGKHTKIYFNVNEQEIAAMYFGVKSGEGDFALGDVVDIVCSLSENIYKNKSSLTLNIKNIRLCEKQTEEEKYYEKLYDDYKKLNIITDELRISKLEMTALYKFLLRQSNAQVSNYNLFALSRTIKNNLPTFNYCKLKLCLKILEELMLIDIEEGNTTEIILKRTMNKVDLFSSYTYVKVGEHNAGV